MSKRYGWTPTPIGTKRLHFGDYLLTKPRTVDVPVTFDFSNNFAFDMLGNDQYGDCVEAAMCHAGQIFTDNNYRPTDSNALQVYGNVTGFTPSNPNSDQGTVITDALKWWIDNPLPGAGGTGINTFLSVNVNNLAEVNTALWLTGSVLIGFNVPYSAEQQFDAGTIWDYVPGSPIVGGHSVPLYGVQGTVKDLITWGQRQAMTAAFWTNYVSEAWIVADESWVTSYGGRAANLLDFAAINTDVAEIWPGTPPPFTDPGVGPPPVVPPNPKDPVAALENIRTTVEGYFAL